MLEITDNITAESRTVATKGHARALRRAGHVPAVAYGPGTPLRHLSLDPHMLVMQRRRFGLSHIYTVTVQDEGQGEGEFKCVIKHIQVNPLTRVLLHVDLYAVDMTRPIKVEVPIELIGKPKGLLEGGLLSQVLRSIEVLCLPGAVPAKLTADVTPLNVGDSLHLTDVVLPEGVKLTNLGNEAVALLAAPEAVTEAVPTPGAPAPAAAASAPAAPGKK